MRSLWGAIAIVIAVAFTASVLMPQDASAKCWPNKRGHSGGIVCKK
jgi:hypothetical protein